MCMHCIDSPLYSLIHSFTKLRVLYLFQCLRGRFLVLFSLVISFIEWLSAFWRKYWGISPDLVGIRVLPRIYNVIGGCTNSYWINGGFLIFGLSFLDCWSFWSSQFLMLCCASALLVGFIPNSLPNTEDKLSRGCPDWLLPSLQLTDCIADLFPIIVYRGKG